MSTIRDLLLKASLKQKKEGGQEEKEFQLALQLSQQEHINEQKKLLEKFARLDNNKFKVNKKKRLIAQEEEEEGEEDDWFQTVSTRPQVKKEKKKVVKEENNLFEFDLSSILNEEEEEEDEEDVELGKFFKDNASTKTTTTIGPADNTLPMVSDAESDDCSVIDLCYEDSEKSIKTSSNTPTIATHTTTHTTNHTNNNTIVHTIDDDDDGYLSPLEGFTSLNDSEVGQQYLAQFELKPTRKRRASSSTSTTTTTTKKKKRFNKRWFNKKKKKDK